MYYIYEDGEVKGAISLASWMKFMRDKTPLAADRVHFAEVITEFTGASVHNLSCGSPSDLFITRIQGGPYNGRYRTNRTEDDAVEMHDRILDALHTFYYGERSNDGAQLLDKLLDK